MLLNTKHFGEIEIKEEEILYFEDGLLGFEQIKKFIMIQNSDPEVPFHWLQAIEDTDLAFVITNPFLFKEDYEFEIPEKVQNQLQIQKQEEVEVFTITVVPEDISKMTINLRGPLILNQEKKLGKQMVLDGEAYPLKYYLFDQEALAARG